MACWGLLQEQALARQAPCLALWFPAVWLLALWLPRYPPALPERLAAPLSLPRQFPAAILEGFSVFAEGITFVCRNLQRGIYNV